MAKIFEDYGISIEQKGDAFFICYDSNEAAGGRIISRSIFEDQARRAMISEGEAYRVLLEVD